MINVDLHQIILSLSYFGIFFIMIINGAVNFPSSQILYLIAGYFVATGKLEFIPTIIAGSLGNTIGNFIIFYLIYKYGKDIAVKYLHLKENTLHKMHKEFDSRGLIFLYVGKLIPSIKVFIPSIAGLSKIKYSHALTLFSLTSIIWSTIIIYIGYFFGEQITFKGYTLTMSIVGIIMLAIAYKKFIKNN